MKLKKVISKEKKRLLVYFATVVLKREKYLSGERIFMMQKK